MGAVREKARRQHGFPAVGDGAELGAGTEVDWHWGRGLRLQGSEAGAVNAHWTPNQTGLVEKAQEEEAQEIHPDGKGEQ